MSESPLSFAALDGLAFAAGRGRLGDLPRDSRYEAGPLGPFMEFWQLSRGGLLPCPDKASWLDLKGIAPLAAALRTKQQQWIGQGGRNAGFFRTGENWPARETAWVGFGLAVQKAAMSSGFHRRIRTGNHAFVIDGQRIDMMAAKMAQKVPMKGFFISVSCRA